VSLASAGELIGVMSPEAHGGGFATTRCIVTRGETSEGNGSAEFSGDLPLLVR
jgi:hypothetical protein